MTVYRTCHQYASIVLLTTGRRLCSASTALLRAASGELEGVVRSDPALPGPAVYLIPATSGNTARLAEKRTPGRKPPLPPRK